VLLQRTLPALGIDGVFDAVISTFDALTYLPTSEFGATVAAVPDGCGPAASLRRPTKAARSSQSLVFMQRVRSAG